MASRVRPALTPYCHAPGRRVDLNAMGEGPNTAGQQVQGALKGREQGERSQEHYGPRLVQACNDFFHYMGAFTGSRWGRSRAATST